jgi:hypothetical protein
VRRDGLIDSGRREGSGGLGLEQEFGDVTRRIGLFLLERSDGLVISAVARGSAWTFYTIQYSICQLNTTKTDGMKNIPNDICISRFEGRDGVLFQGDIGVVSHVLNRYVIVARRDVGHTGYIHF